VFTFFSICLFSLANLESLCYLPTDFTHPLIDGALLFSMKSSPCKETGMAVKKHKELQYGKYIDEVIT
jgi:hypothetical protein